MKIGEKSYEKERTFQRPAVGRVAANNNLPSLPRWFHHVLLSHNRPVGEGEAPPRGQVLDHRHDLHRIPHDPALDQARAIPLNDRQDEIGTQTSGTIALSDDVPHARNAVGHRGGVD